MSTDKLPSSRDFTPQAVRKAVFWESVQHPFTVFPLGASGLSLLYLALINVSLAPFIICYGGVLVGVGAWVVNYFIRGDKLAARYIKKLKKKFEQQKQSELVELQNQFAAYGLPEVSDTASEMHKAYKQLQEFLQRKGNEDPGTQRFLVLANDSYREGAKVLRTALTIAQVLDAIDSDKLENELHKWTVQQQRLEKSSKADSGKGSAKIKALTIKIDSHTRLLQLYQQRSDMLEELIAQLEELKAALQGAYLEMVDLFRREVAFDYQKTAASRLERAVKAARTVEERLRNVGQPSSDDDVYLQAGEK